MSGHSVISDNRVGNSNNSNSDSNSNDDINGNTNNTANARENVISQGNNHLVVIFGATGSTGTHVIRMALNNGYRVRAFVRSPEKLTAVHEKLEVFQGDLTRRERVISALEGADLVISTAGVVGNEYPKRLMRNFVEYVVEGMRQHGVKRLIYQAGAFSPASGRWPSLQQYHLRQTLGKQWQILPMLRDNDSVLRYLNRVKDVEWVVSRPGALVEQSTQGKLQTSKKLNFGEVSFVDLAHWTLRAATDAKLVRKAPFVGYARV